MHYERSVFNRLNNQRNVLREKMLSPREMESWLYNRINNEGAICV